MYQSLSDYANEAEQEDGIDEQALATRRPPYPGPRLGRPLPDAG